MFETVIHHRLLAFNPRAVAHTHKPNKYRDLIIQSYLGLLLITVCCFALEYAPQPLFNLISAEFGIGQSATGLLVGVFMLSLSLSPIFVGALLNRIGAKRAILGASLCFSLSAFGYLLVDSYGQLITLRAFQAFLMPVVLTAVMASITTLFRHLDLKRALAGYVSMTLAGALLGRFLSGCLADFLGWRLTLAFFGLLFCGGFLVIFNLSDIPQASVRPETSKGSTLKRYRQILLQPGVFAILLVEACGYFVFAAVGNLLPFRMAELGQGASEGLIGIMYAGYIIGLVATFVINPLKRALKSNTAILAFGSFLYFIAVASLYTTSLWVVFSAIWGMAFGQFLVHSLSPGLMNGFASKQHQFDRGMINGLYLTCYNSGGLLGSILPGFIHAQYGWRACVATLQGALLISFLTVCFLMVQQLNHSRCSRQKEECIS